MNPAYRELFVHIVIVLALCIGAWLFILQPRVDETGRIQEVIAEHTSAMDGPSQEIVERLAEHVADLRRKIDRVRQRNELARDSSMIYSRIMELAAEHEVEVRNLHPGQESMPRDEAKFVTRTVNVSVLGDFERIADFVHAVDEMGGFTRTGSLTLSPQQQSDKDLVHANLTVEMMIFDLLDSAKLAARASSDSP